MLQKEEMTHHKLYLELSKLIKQKKNKKILEEISFDELGHYNILKTITKKDIEPDHFKIKSYIWIARTLGISFAIRKLEKNEEQLVKSYSNVKLKQVEKIIKEGEMHEEKLMSILYDEKVEYAGAIVLGLNDALIELTGAMAGLVNALQSTKLAGITGLIIGAAAAPSMAASSYFAFKEEVKSGEDKSPIKAAVYTGLAYVFTVFLLIFPFFLTKNMFIALGAMLLLAIMSVAVYTYYISIAKNQEFWPRFWEMVILKFAVVSLAFAIGYGLRVVFNLDITVPV